MLTIEGHGAAVSPVALISERNRRAGWVAEGGWVSSGRKPPGFALLTPLGISQDVGCGAVPSPSSRLRAAGPGSRPRRPRQPSPSHGSWAPPTAGPAARCESCTASEREHSAWHPLPGPDVGQALSARRGLPVRPAPRFSVGSLRRGSVGLLSPWPGRRFAVPSSHENCLVSCSAKQISPSP